MLVSSPDSLAGEASGLSDTELVVRVRGGERWLYEALMRRHNRKVFRALRALLDDDGEAEDAAQEAWVKAYAALDQFEGRSSFATWVVRIAVHEGLARRRLAGRFTEVAMGSLITPGAGPEVDAHRAELRRLLSGAIDELPEGQRAVFVLREVEGMSTAETAAALGISEENVKVRLHRARQALRRAVARQLGAELTHLYAFAGERCDRVTAAVMGRISPPL